MTTIKLELTPAEARALSLAVSMSMDSDYWTNGPGTDRQYAALERARAKLSGAHKAKKRRVDALINCPVCGSNQVCDDSYYCPSCLARIRV